MLESLHWWCSLDIDNSRPETAEKTAKETGCTKLQENGCTLKFNLKKST